MGRTSADGDPPQAAKGALSTLRIKEPTKRCGERIAVPQHGRCKRLRLAGAGRHLFLATSRLGTILRDMRGALSFSVVVALALAVAHGSRAADSADTCVRFWAEAHYGALGYNHLVHVANSCSADAECDVSTDVNPDAQKVTVAAKSETVVTTFMGSPARAFKPRVKCVMRTP